MLVYAILARGRPGEKRLTPFLQSTDERLVLRVVEVFRDVLDGVRDDRPHELPAASDDPN